MKRRNPGDPQRPTEANKLKTIARVEQYYGICALLSTWESQSEEVQADNHDYIIRLRARGPKRAQLSAEPKRRNDPNMNLTSVPVLDDSLKASSAEPGNTTHTRSGEARDGTKPEADSKSVPVKSVTDSRGGGQKLCG